MNETEMNIAEKSLRYLAQKMAGADPGDVDPCGSIRPHESEWETPRAHRDLGAYWLARNLFLWSQRMLPVSRSELRPVISQQNYSHDEHVMHS